MRQDLQPPPVERASYPARTGNDVRILIDGEEAFGRIFDVAASASKSIWITVSFVQLDVVIPGTGLPLLDFLERRAEAGIDVRLLFWWSEFAGIGSFRGDETELEMLRNRGAKLKMRWDHIERGCHHQKSYVIDETIAFVGGINLNYEALSSRRHDREGYHDLFAELGGPAVADVASNFIQRWNQATETLSRGHAYPSIDHAGDLPAAMEVSRSDPGRSTVQVVRTVRAGLYADTYGWPIGAANQLSDGEHSIRDTVYAWIDAARTQVYIENQFLLDVATITRLEAACGRGVEVICVAPLEPDPNLLLYPKDELRRSREALTRLAQTSRFGLFGLRRDAPPYQPIYIHAKLMIVDDQLLMVGSANLWPPSFNRDSELNVCVWDSALAIEARERLWNEHLQAERAEGLDDWLEHARADRDRRGRGEITRTRLERADPAAYYEFPETLEAPWQHLRGGPS